MLKLLRLKFKEIKIMYTFKSWWKIFALLLMVFLLSGCGGSGSYSENLGSNPSPTPTPTPYEEPNNEPDKYDFLEVLAGTWYGLGGSGTATGVEGLFTAELETMRERFINVEINGDTGTALMTGYQTWRVVHQPSNDAYRVRFNNYRDEVNIVHIGSDTWRLEYSYDTGESTTVILKLTSAKTLEASQSGVTEIDGYVYDYDFTLQARKQ